MMTARGIGWLFLSLIAWLALAVSGLSHLKLVLAILLVLPLVSLLLLWRLRQRTSLTQQLEKPVIKRGETTALQVRVSLRSHQMIPQADLLLQKTSVRDLAQEETCLATLLPAGETVLNVKMTGHHRGIYAVGLKRLRCRDLFGLFRIVFFSCPVSRLTHQLAVLPAAYAFARLPELTALLREQQQQRSWKPGSDLDTIADIRQQQPGDALKRAHWKLTARMDELMIREFENPLQQETMILCDMAHQAASPVSQQLYSDFYCDSAAYLASLILHEGSAVRMIAWTGEGRIETAATHSGQESDLLLFLARLSASGHWQPERLIEEELARYPNTRIFCYITSRLQEATIRQLTLNALDGRDIWLFLLRGNEPIPDDQDMSLLPLLQAGVNIHTIDFDPYRAGRTGQEASRPDGKGVAG